MEHKLLISFQIIISLQVIVNPQIIVSLQILIGWVGRKLWLRCSMHSLGSFQNVDVVRKPRTPRTVQLSKFDHMKKGPKMYRKKKHSRLLHL